VKEFFDTFYVPDNATRRHRRRLRPQDRAGARAHALRAHPEAAARRCRGSPWRSRLQAERRELSRNDPNAPLPAVASAFKLPPTRGHADTYPLQVAFDILSVG
jgi:hypothetical protein